jgi:hypothetical protein
MSKKEQTAAQLNAEAKTKLPCGITAEQLAEWKKLHGADNVKHIPVYTKADKSHFHSLIVRRPDMEAISKASKFASEPIKAGLVLYNECRLANDPEIEAQANLKASACRALTSMFKIYESEVLDL